MPSGFDYSGRVLAWAVVMGGPIAGTVFGVAGISLLWGWLGALLILTHPIRPSEKTACLTVLGLLLWFSAGFVTMMELAWAG